MDVHPAIAHRVITGVALVMSGGFAITGDARADDGIFSVTPALTIDVLDNMSGGRRTGARTMYNLDLTASWKGERGWEAWGYVLVDGNGGFSNRYSGDLQTLSNIDAVPATRLFEAWARYTSADTRWRTTLGVINLNAVFDTQPVGGVFLNSSDGIGPDYSQSGPPIFPVTGLGAVAEWRMTWRTTLRASVSDGVPGDPEHPKAFAALHLRKAEGLHRVVELEHHFDNGFLKLGHWDYTVAGERWNDKGPGIRQGSYAQFGWYLIKEVADASQGLQGWVRVGNANGDVFKLDQYVGGGLVYTGFFAGHDNDQMGLAVMQARLGQPYRAFAGAPRATETAVEMTYKMVVGDHVIVQPDMQYIRNPGGEGALKDALVLGVRLRVQ